MIPYALLLIMALSASCIKQDKDERKTYTGGGSANAPGGGSGNQNPKNSKAPRHSTTLPLRELLKSCEDLGRAWSAELLACGGPLTSFPCCEDQIRGRYPSLNKELDRQADAHPSQSLYHCEEVGEGEIHLHFIQVTEQKYQYSIVESGPLSEAEVAEDLPNCPQAPLRTGAAKDYRGEVDGVVPVPDGTSLPENDDKEAEELDGKALYQTYCSRCHSDPETKKGRSVSAITNAIKNQTVMAAQADLKKLVNDQKRLKAIADWLK